LEKVLTMSTTGSATLSRTSPFSRGSAHAEAALPACSIMRAMFSAKRSGSFTRYCSTAEGSASSALPESGVWDMVRGVPPEAFS
jgi:hypothetical protein